MLLRTGIALVSAAMLVVAAEKKPPEAQAENGDVALAATLYNGKDAVKQEVGDDLGGYFIVLQVTITPKSGKPLSVHWDDFLLRSDSDGQRCQPFAPSQIAGRSVLVVSDSGGGGGIVAENPGTVWGPIGGGRPQRMGGDSATMGNAGGDSSAQAAITSGAHQKQNPLMATLTRKALAQKATTEPLSGLLYFSLDGKHKPKDLELQYNGPAGKLSLRFRK